MPAFSMSFAVTASASRKTKLLFGFRGKAGRSWSRESREEPYAGNPLGLWCKPAEMRENDATPSFVPVEELFAGRHFDAEIVVLCVRWYLSFKLSYRDLVSMMSERGIRGAHATILRWMQHYMPEFEKRWKRYARAVGDSWRMDEATRTSWR